MSTQTITIQALTRVTDPVTNARVEIYRDGVLVASGTTDQYARASFTLEHGYTYYVTIKHPSIGFAIRSFSVPYPGNEVGVEVPDFLVVTIVDERNQRRLDNVHVLVEGPENHWTERRTAWGTAWVRLWGQGQYKVTVRHEGFKRAVKVYDYRIPHTGDIHDTIVISPTRLSVFVRDPQGNPVQGALVKLISRDGKVVREAITS